MDVDGPCAAPQGTLIQESMADPLGTLGLILIAVSYALAVIYFAVGDFGVNNNSRQD